MSANVLKIDKLLHDHIVSEDDKTYSLDLVFSFDNGNFSSDKTNQEIKDEKKDAIVEEITNIIPDFNKDDNIGNFIDKIESNNMKMIILYQNNFLDDLLDNTKDFNSMMSTVLFIITENERMINYIAKCINSSSVDNLKADSSDARKELILAKINSFTSSDDNIVKNCSVLGINKQRYDKDTRQILFKEIKHIYENVYGLNEIPKLNISFNNNKNKKDYDKNMYGDLIRTKFDSLLTGSKIGITPVQTALSYFGLCDNIEENNTNRKNKQIELNNKLKLDLKLPTEDENLFKDSKTTNSEKSNILVKNAEIRLNSIDELIKQLQNGLDNSIVELNDKLNIDYNDKTKIEQKINDNKQEINKLQESIKNSDGEAKEKLENKKILRDQLDNKLSDALQKLENDIENEEIIPQIENLENQIYDSLEKTRSDLQDIINHQADKNNIKELKEELENSDFRKYYVALAVSDKIKNFSASEIENRKNATYNTSNPNYKKDFADFNNNNNNRYTKLDYFPEADLVEAKTVEQDTCLSYIDSNGKPLLTSIFKCLIQKYEFF